MSALPPNPASSADTPPGPDVDLFCKVIDNFGDIGVCWRLARRLQHELGQQVRLWVDDLKRFSGLEPTIQLTSARQRVQGVEVRHWAGDDGPWPAPAALVIEAFACDLPQGYRRQLQSGTTWLNLEYLSAESWVESCHGLPSPQPEGVDKYFHFPGFSPATGGLLREQHLIAERDQWQAAPALRQKLWQNLGVPSALAAEAAAGERRVALVFCYPSAALAALRQSWTQSEQPWLILLAGGSGRVLLESSNDHVAAHALPLVSQPEFDRLLWSSDLNLVRGEDSFVRAQWAARPMLWHIYHQDGGAHLSKLEAWLERSGAPERLATLHRAWNPLQAEVGEAGMAAALLALDWSQELAHWQQWAGNWCENLLQLPELACSLVQTRDPKKGKPGLE